MDDDAPPPTYDQVASSINSTGEEQAAGVAAQKIHVELQVNLS